MLQRLRDKAQGWIAWIIMGIIGLTFVLFGTEALFQGNSSRTQAIAKVNGTKITAQELDNAYQQLLRQSGNGSLRNLDPDFVKKELLQSLIEQVVLLQTATKLGMSISITRVTGFIDAIPFLLDEAGQFSQTAYAQFLANANYTDRSFRTLLHDSLLREQLQQGITQTALSLPAEIQDLAKYILQKRDFRFAVIAREPFEKLVTVQNKDIQDYYINHQQDFMTVEQVALEYIPLSLNDLMDKLKPTENDLEQFYKENIALFTQPESVHIAHILIAVPKNADKAATEKALKQVKDIEQQLAKGASFSDLAKKYSDDKGSAPSGGDLEWQVRGEMMPEFEKVAFSLQKPGEISKPVRTDFGFHLIKLMAKKPETVQSFEQVKNEVAEKYKKQFAEEKLINLAEELSTLAYDTPDSLQGASDKLGLSLLRTELFTQEEGPKEPLLQNSEVIAAAFSNHVKQDKNNSDLIKIDDDNYVVLRAATYVPSKQKTLDEVKSEVKNILINDQSDVLTKNQAEKVVAAIDKNESQAFAQLTWQDRQNIPRTAPEVDADVLAAAFSLPRALNDKSQKAKTVRLANNDYAVIWLTGIHDGNISSLSAKEKENYQHALIKHWGELEFALYANELFNHAKVVNKAEKI
ncbi:MAG: SurA N-terminal domain-containing protein [Candidatus Berkiellales bacterium]